MTQRNRAAMHIQAVFINAQFFGESHWHRTESFIDFIDVDIVDRQTRFIKRALHSRNRRFQHNHRIMTHHRQVNDFRQRLHIQLFQALFINNHDARCAVANLAGRRSGNNAAFGQQLDALNAFKAGIKANAFINLVQFFVAILIGHFNRHNLFIKSTGLRRRNGALMAAIGVRVDIVFAQLIFFGDHFGTGKLAELHIRITLLHRRADIKAVAFFEWQRNVETHWHAAHALNTGGNNAIHRARHNRLRGKMNGLLAGAALAVNRCGRNALRQARCQNRIAANIGSLLTNLAYAAHNDIFNHFRFGTCTVEQIVNDPAC